MVSVSCLSAMLTTVVAMFLSHKVAPVDACSCLLGHPQSTFCTTDWAIKAKVKTNRLVKNPNSTYHQVLRLYGVKISKVFKEGKQRLVQGSYVKLYSAPFDSLCGASLKLNTTYYIQGLSEKGLLRFGLCDTPREWLSIPPVVRMGYKYLYKKNCLCTIETSMRKQHASNSSCRMSSSWDFNQKQCYRDHAVCVPGQQNNEVSPLSSSCKWSRRGLFTKCMRSANDKSSKTRFNWEP